VRYIIGDIGIKQLKHSCISYKQTKVNLLREQSEGYSKFIIELCNSLGTPQDVTKGSEVEPQAVLSHRTQQAQDRLMKIAGYFDLDPTRMLDLTVDVFSTHVMTHFDFCISLIRQFMSSRTRLLCGTRLEETMETEKPNSFVGMDLNDVLSASEGQVPTIPSSAEYKNPLAQIVGFKFAYYEVSETPI
jgi:THO complex subunit 2